MARMADDDALAPALRIGAVASALGVSVDTLRRWEQEGRVQFERRGGQRFLDAETLARLLRDRSPARHSSARNRFEGVVLSVTRDKVMAKVEMACGPYRVVSLMSREAADELGLKPGSVAEAVVKSTNVMIETRDR
jgi:molybdopterin-binding protein